jgi:tRNA-specific 2-thiouridylase
MTRIVVAMSGGVDSSVVAALLKQQGHEVIGMMMRLWSEPGNEAANRCCTPDALSMARRVASRLEIPFYALDAQKIFRDVVVQYFMDGYAQGITPNPCLVCNRFIRWDFLLHRALTAGADYLATGHYARLDPLPAPFHPTTGSLSMPGSQTQKDGDGIGKIQLLRGLDAQKDQSYVLSVLTQDQLRHAVFPLGAYTKKQVRQLARDFGLPVAERAESQDLCFLGNEDYRNFLSRYIPDMVLPGLIVSKEGKQLGEHKGLAFYTIGQRKGLGISSPVPMYVLKKDTSRNRLVVGRVDELGGQELTASNVNWISGEPPTVPVRARVKIRYKAKDAWGLISPVDHTHVQIRFDESLRDITPGQAVVFYEGDNCLGGGIIEI